MQCPVCNIALMMSDRNGIEIDYCPQCRGVWLDRGELDKIIERSSTGPTQQPQFQQPQHAQHQQPSYRHDDDDDDHYRHQDSGHGHHKKHKKENFLGELFDF